MEACNHIEVNLDYQSPTMDFLGMVVTRIDRVPAISSGMGLVAGLIVRAVRLGGIADLAGVASGDIICEVDGCPVLDICDLDKILVERDPHEPVRMLFRRVGAWRYLAVPCEDSILTTENAMQCLEFRMFQPQDAIHSTSRPRQRLEFFPPQQEVGIVFMRA